MRGFLLSLTILTLLGCGEKSKTMEYFLANKEERLVTHKECQSKTWKDRKTPECIAARQAQEQTAMALVRGVLKDPESAIFSDLIHSWDTALCGKVNAKNSYGGYAGKQRFIVENGTVNFFDDIPKTEREEKAAKRCLDWIIQVAKSGDMF